MEINKVATIIYYRVFRIIHRVCVLIVYNNRIHAQA